MIEKKPFSVLIVDDNSQNLQVLADILEGCGYEIGFAMSGKQALDYIRLEKPDLILLDVMMPEMDGYEACSIMKRDPELMDIPVIFLTAKVETQDIVKGFEAGGIDYIQKPFNIAELKSRVKTHLELKRTNDELKRSFEELRDAKNVIELQNQKLEEIMKQLEISSNTDPLTGLYNRRKMYLILNEQIEIGERFSVVMADIDHFKQVNDSFGHNVGDDVLKKVSQIISSSIRKADSLSRWGGEEFLIMFSGTNKEDALLFTERIREKICAYNFNLSEEKKHLTMTFGVSEFLQDEAIDEVIKRADNALYEGKNTGRNKIVAI